MLDEARDLIRILDTAFNTKPVPLAEVAARRPGAYLHLYTGDLHFLSRARRPDGKAAMAPICSAGGAAVYIGSAKDLGERQGRHIRNLLGVTDLPASDLQVVCLETDSLSGAVYAEACLISALGVPVLNCRWLSGMGSKAQGSNRTGQRVSAFNTLFPGRQHGCTRPAKLSRDELERRVVAHLASAVPDVFTISCDPRPSTASPLRLVTRVV